VVVSCELAVKVCDCVEVKLVVAVVVKLVDVDPVKFGLDWTKLLKVGLLLLQLPVSQLRVFAWSVVVRPPSTKLLKVGLLLLLRLPLSQLRVFAWSVVLRLPSAKLLKVGLLLFNWSVVVRAPSSGLRVTVLSVAEPNWLVVKPSIVQVRVLKLLVE